jgi:nicotinamidase-related amidase
MRIPPPSRRRGKLSRARAADAALALIDFQPQMIMGVESHDRNAIKNNLQIIAKSAKLFNVKETR